MLRKYLLRFTLLSLMFCLTTPFGFAQRHTSDLPADAIAEVPELHSFHEVIFIIWHEAWPEKNAALLRKLLPDVERGISEVAAAKLPGILREKKAVWEANIKRLQTAGTKYKAAADANDAPRLLAAAEELHRCFEILMRSLRPVSRELEDFHEVLYMLYHHYLPDYHLENIRSSAAELMQKMAIVNSVELPERLKQAEPAFLTARSKLSESVGVLKATVTIDDEKRIRGAVETLHTNYRELMHVFE